MFVSLVPASFDDLAGVAFVLFLCGVCKETNVVMDIKVEERSRLATGFVDNERVEGVMVRYYQILLLRFRIAINRDKKV